MYGPMILKATVWKARKLELDIQLWFILIKAKCVWWKYMSVPAFATGK